MDLDEAIIVGHPKAMPPPVPRKDHPEFAGLAKDRNRAISHIFTWLKTDQSRLSWNLKEQGWVIGGNYFIARTVT